MLVQLVHANVLLIQRLRAAATQPTGSEQYALCQAALNIAASKLRLTGVVNDISTVCCAAIASCYIHVHIHIHIHMHCTFCHTN